MMSDHSKTTSATSATGATGAIGGGPAPEAGAVEETFEFLKLKARLGGGETITFDAVAGMHLVELMRASGVPITAECGGAGACATCHIRLADSWRDRVSEANAEEHDKLDEIPGADERSRLACQIVMSEDLDGLEFEIQEDSLSLDKSGAGK